MDPFIRRRIIKIATISLAAVISVIIFVLIQQNGRLSLELPDDARVITITRQSDGEEFRSVELDEGTEQYNTFLPSDKYEVFVSSENQDQATSYFVEVPSFLRTVSRNVELHNQSEREKIGIGSFNCPIFSGDELYSYSCEGSNNLGRVATLSVENHINRNMIDTPTLLATQSYRDGILALYTSEYLDEGFIAPTLIFIRNGIVVTQKNLPDALNIDVGETADYFLRINEQDPEKFLITVNGNRTMLTFNNFEDTGVSLNISENHDYVNQLTDALRYSGDRITYALGSSSVGHQDPINESAAQGAHIGDGLQVRQYTISENEAQLDRIVDFEGAHAESASLCTPSHICLNERETTTVHSLEDPAQSLATIYGVTSRITPLDSSRFIYLKGNRAFIMNTENLESRQIYFSNNLNVNSLTISPKGIILNAFSTDGRKYAYSFLIPTPVEPSSGNTFIDNTLPIGSGGLDGAVRISDYYRDRIEVRLDLNSWESPVRASGGGISLDEYTYNQSEFNEKRNTVLQYLQDNGINADTHTINIAP